jgi:membrane protein DedA with SNARE-associated domain
VLLHHTHGALANFGRVLVGLFHGSIFSRVGASTKSGAVQVFKKIFGEHPALLMDFLNALPPLPADGLIVALGYLAPEQIPVIPGLLKPYLNDK